MQQEKIAILIDTGTDVPANLIKEYGLYTVPLKIIFSDGEYSDGIDLTASELYQRLPQEIPKTSLPDGQSVLATIAEIKAAGYDKLLIITISSGLSGTYNLLHLLTEHYEGLDTYVLDTKNISIGSGFLAIWAAECLRQGMDWTTLKATMNDHVSRAKVFFCLETLEYLQKGGRIGMVTAVLGTAFNLKPVISCNPDGIYYTMAKVRGRHQSIHKIIDLAEEYSKKGQRYNLAIYGSGRSGLEEAAKIREEILRRLPNHHMVFESELGCCLGVHVGPGLVGIGVHLLD